MPVVIHPRTRLRKFLENELKSLKNNSSSEGARLQQLLRQAIEGLVALEYGESQSIFRARSKNGAHDGTRPYTLRKLRMQALGFADLLIKNKYKGKSPAIDTVASAFGVHADAFRVWRKNTRLGRTTDPVLKSFRAEIAGQEWDQVSVLAQLMKAGERYQEVQHLAHKSKK